MLKLNTKKFRLFTLSGLLLISHHAVLQTQACGRLVTGCCELTGMVARGCCDASCCLLRAFCCCTLSEEVSYTARQPDILPGESPEETRLRRQIAQLERMKDYLGTSQSERERLQWEIVSLTPAYMMLKRARLGAIAQQTYEERVAAEKLAQEQAMQARMEPTSPSAFPLQQ